MQDKNKISKIQSILNEKSLDVAFIFSNKGDSRYSTWCFGLKAFDYHYFSVDKNGEFKIFEIDYLRESLGQALQEFVLDVDEENLFHEALSKYVNEKGYKNIAYAGLAPLSHFDSLIKSGINFTNIQHEIDQLLVEKTDSDLEKIKKAAEIHTQFINTLTYENMVGKTEAEVAELIKENMLKIGEQESFPVSVMTGERLKYATAGSPTDQLIEEKGVVCIDNGFVIGKFYTDMTRMFFSKDNPKKVVYDKLVNIQHQVVGELEVGMTLQTMCDLYDAKFKETFGDYEFERGDLGHSIGFGLHEEPIFMQEQNKEYKIPNNFVFTLEPEIVIEGYRYRVEDMVASRGGVFEILTK